MNKWMPWLTVVLSALVSTAYGSDWPTYMHDRTRAGHTPEQLVGLMTEQWVRSSSAPPEWAWPGPGGKTIEGLALKHRVRFDDVFHVVAVENRAYYGSSVDNTVYCVDTESGETVWKFITSAPVRLAPTVDNNRVYFGSDDGNVYCLDSSNGQLFWQFRPGPRDERILARGRMASRWPVRTGVLVDQGIAYFGAGIFPHETVYVYAVDATTGKVIWKNDTVSQRDAGRNDLTPQGYLLATDDRLFVPSGRTLPAAFDRTNGEMLHKQLGGGKQIGGTEAMLDDDDILSVGEHHILAIDQVGGSIDNRLRGRRMTLHDNMAYVADGKEIIAIERQKYGEVKDERLKLEGELAKTQRAILRHLAPTYLEYVQKKQAEIASQQQAIRKLTSEKRQDTDEFKTAELALANSLKELDQLSQKYEASRKDYQKLNAAVKKKQDEINELTQRGIKWRVGCDLESSMILTGNRLIVGGPGRFALFDIESGEEKESHAVDGEVRGLACANGRLYVSTTVGNVYCFADQNRKKTDIAKQSIASQANPFPDDDLTAVYSSAAEEIIRNSSVTRGYCLVLGSGKGRLAYELARQSTLNIYCVETDAKLVSEAREALLPTGLYGNRIVVDHVDLAALPHPNYFANLIVCDSILRDGTIPADAQQIANHLKPAGGVLCLGVPKNSSDEIKRDAMTQASEWTKATKLEDENAEVAVTENWTLLTRDVLPGAAGWTHQYGNPGNTSSIADERVRGGLRVLWYGDPGPSSMTNRHEGAVGPVSEGGRLFVQGDKSVMAYDAFNGGFLWEKYNPDALRTGVFNNHESGNLVATSKEVFMVQGHKCLHINAATGQTIRTYEIPDYDGDPNRQWGFVAHHDGRLFGTSTVRKMLAKEARRRGRASEASNTDKIFAIDIETGDLLWSHQGQNISHTTIAIDDHRLYFIDAALTIDARERLLKQDKSELEKLTGEARQIAEDRMKRIDARRAVALDVATGKPQWSEAVDVTDCTGVGIGAGRLTVMVSGKHLVLCGANANGHYWKQFLAGEFKRRRLVVLSAETGKKLWAKDANYRHRPIIVGNRLVAEPWAFDLASGEQLMRKHPLTGEESPWKFIRPGHHCGAISATPNMMFFRSKFTAYYDFDQDSGTRHFGGHRLGCWINQIPANGLLMIPEASAGCACLFSLTSTITFEPLEERQVWSVYTAEGATKPVQHMAVNLGAPGDRRDAHGKLWLSYPRPSSRAGVDLPLQIKTQSPDGISGSYMQKNSESYEVADADVPWLFSSAMLGVTRCELPLLDSGQPESQYKVRLYFAALDDDQLGQRVFDIRFQGKTVQSDLDVVKQTGGVRKALVLEFDNVAVSENLVIDLLPKSGQEERNMPTVCAVEVLRAGASEIIKEVAQR